MEAELEMIYSTKSVQKSIVILSFFLIGLPSCSNSPQLEKSFQTAVPVLDMNRSLELAVEGDKKILRLGPEISLIIRNRSSKSISFEPDSHISLFMIEDNEWIETQNVITYSGSLVLSPEDTPLLDYARTRVQPEVNQRLLNAKAKELLRIVVIGEIMENDKPTGELVGAYVDVYLTP